MKFISGYYGFFRGKEHKIRSTTKSWKIYLNENTISSQVIEIEQKNAKMKIESAYIVRTKAKYKSFVFTTFQNENLKKEGKVGLYLDNLDFDAYDFFGFNYRNDDAQIIVEISELEEIWEERKRLSNFPFKVDKVKILKSKN